MDPGDLRSWIGRTGARAGQGTPAPIAALAATHDREEPFPEAGDRLSRLWASEVEGAPATHATATPA